MEAGGNKSDSEWYIDEWGQLKVDFREEVLRNAKVVFSTLARVVKNQFYYKNSAEFTFACFLLMKFCHA